MSLHEREPDPFLVSPEAWGAVAVSRMVSGECISVRVPGGRVPVFLGAYREQSLVAYTFLDVPGGFTVGARGPFVLAGPREPGQRVEVHWLGKNRSFPVYEGSGAWLCVVATADDGRELIATVGEAVYRI